MRTIEKIHFNNLGSWKYRDTSHFRNMEILEHKPFKEFGILKIPAKQREGLIGPVDLDRQAAQRLRCKPRLWMTCTFSAVVMCERTCYNRHPFSGMQVRGFLVKQDVS